MRREQIVGAASAALAILYAAPSVLYPMSWDTSVHYYVGREWALRGAIPYRDAFDHKLPGIHAVHAVLVALFGETMAAIRVFEIGCILALGAAAAWVVSEPPRFRADIAGLTALASSILYFGCFDHWSTAQPELPSATLVAIAYAVVRRGRSRPYLVGGLLTGAAFLLKPTVLLLIAVVFVDAARVGRRRAVLPFVGGAVVLPFATVAYFAAHGALGAMIEAVYGANAVYTTVEARAHTAGEALAFLVDLARTLAPLSLVAGTGLAAAVVRAGRRRLAREHAVAAALVLAAIVSVVVQRKFYVYHMAVLFPGVALFLALGLRALDASKRRGHLLAPAALAMGAIAHHFIGPFASRYERDAATTWRWVTGRLSRDEFVARYDHVPGRRPFSTMDRIGTYLKERTRPDDLVLVRGESAEIYVVSGRRAPGRFFWSVFLSSTTRVYRRDAWLEEDRDAIVRGRPRYVVCPANADGPSSVAYFEALGYQPETQFGPYTVLANASPR